MIANSCVVYLGPDDFVGDDELLLVRSDGRYLCEVADDPLCRLKAGFLPWYEEVATGGS